MLRILIMSDSHGRNENVELAIAQVREEIGEFQMLIHLAMSAMRGRLSRWQVCHATSCVEIPIMMQSF